MTYSIKPGPLRIWQPQYFSSDLLYVLTRSGYLVPAVFKYVGHVGERCNEPLSPLRMLVRKCEALTKLNTTAHTTTVHKLLVAEGGHFW
jgi:hypothetical protein